MAPWGLPLDPPLGSDTLVNVLPPTFTCWIRSTPYPSTPTSPGAASSESVSSVTGECGHSVHWSVFNALYIVSDISIG